MGVTAACSKPVSLLETSSGASRMLKFLMPREPPSSLCCLCISRLSFSAWRRAAYCTEEHQRHWLASNAIKQHVSHLNDWAFQILSEPRKRIRLCLPEQSHNSTWGTLLHPLPPLCSPSQCSCRGGEHSVRSGIPSSIPGHS